MHEETRTIHGEPSFVLDGDLTSVAITRRGGHMVPVYFRVRVDGREAAPYSLSPWKPDECPPNTPPILQVLRGDFFCLPFGDNGGQGYIHGETANLNWALENVGANSIRLKLDINDPPGTVVKTIGVRAGERAVYQKHVVSGVEGPYNFGHHAVLKFPEDEGPYYINASRFRFGATRPDPFTDPAMGEYSALKVNASFRSLDRVPLAAGGTTSLRKFPARAGFEDLVMVSSSPGNFAWTAATLDGYVWISLKDPRILPSTLFWFSNGGRHYAPWNGQHRHRVGLEEVNSHFNDGLTVSREERIKNEGIPTVHYFEREKVTRVRVIQLVHPVPEDFGMVSKVLRKRGGGGIVISNTRGQSVEAPVDWTFLYEERDLKG